jgi:outer membrane protein assembly factor BamB
MLGAARLPIAGLLLAAGLAPARAGDWPQVLGPNRDGIAAADERLAETWPADGPPVEWRRDVGAGYAGVAVAGGRALLFHRVGKREVVEAIDAATGKALWSDGHPTTFTPQVGGGDGPLCTPVIHDGRVIVFGAQGILACLDLATGGRLWQRDTHREFDAQEGYFGAGSTPLVVGGHVLVNVGGSRQEAGIVAFDLGTGETKWKATAEPASYSSPVEVDIAGVPHAVFVTRYQCLLIEAATGGVKWRFPFGMRGPTVNAATPLVMSAGNAAEKRLLVTAAYGIGSVNASFDGQAAQTLWEGTESLATQYCTPIAAQGILLAIDGRDDVPPADLKAVEAATGRVLWVERGFGYGTLLSADGKLLAAKTDGELVLMRADAKGMNVLARARPLAGTIRALPSLAAGRLYVRDDSVLTCLHVGP